MTRFETQQAFESQQENHDSEPIKDGNRRDLEREII